MKKTNKQYSLLKEIEILELFEDTVYKNIIKFNEHKANTEISDEVHNAYMYLHTNMRKIQDKFSVCDIHDDDHGRFDFVAKVKDKYYLIQTGCRDDISTILPTFMECLPPVVREEVVVERETRCYNLDGWLKARVVKHIRQKK